MLSSGVGQYALEHIQYDDIAESMKSALRSALQQSGFAGKSSDGYLNFLPCPAGTFVNSSEKGYPDCKMCPPGNSTFKYIRHSVQLRPTPNTALLMSQIIPTAETFNLHYSDVLFLGTKRVVLNEQWI